MVGMLLAPALLCAAETPAALMEQGHFKRARALVEQQYRANPNDPETLWAKSTLAHVWKDRQSALDFAERALADNPKEARYHLRVADVVGDMAEKAGFLKQVSLGRRFKREVDAALELDPKNVEALMDLIGYYFMAPAIIGGDKAKARGFAEQVMRIDPVAGYNAQIQVAHFEKRTPPFEEIYRKSVAARPTAYMPHIQLGGVLVGQKKYDEAMEQAREALRIDPGRTYGYTLQAIVLALQDKWTDLDAALAQAEKGSPDDFTPFYRAGVLCLDKPSELARAERCLRKYLSQEPEPDGATHANAHWRLGQALEKQGRKGEAIGEWQIAVKMDANSKAKDDLKRVK